MKRDEIHIPFPHKIAALLCSHAIARHYFRFTGRAIEQEVHREKSRESATANDYFHVQE